MTITTTLADSDGGTEIVAVHEGLQPGVPPADNEFGWREALAKLAALVEADDSAPTDLKGTVRIPDEDLQASSANSERASRRSRVSKPSVNHA